jgi:hypothetical protein
MQGGLCVPCNGTDKFEIDMAAAAVGSRRRLPDARLHARADVPTLRPKALAVRLVPSRATGPRVQMVEMKAKKEIIT